MDVAVGGTNGWFPDGAGDKPWLDQSNSKCRIVFAALLDLLICPFIAAMYDFTRAQSQWYSTWPTDPKKRGMAV